jgi:hypothetical protein
MTDFTACYITTSYFIFIDLLNSEPGISKPSKKDNSVANVTVNGWKTWVRFPTGEGIFLIFTMSRLTLEPTHLLANVKPGHFSRRKSGRSL